MEKTGVVSVEEYTINYIEKKIMKITGKEKIGFSIIRPTLMHWNDETIMTLRNKLNYLLVAVYDE